MVNQQIQMDVWSVLLILGVFQGIFILPLLLQKKTQPSRWLAFLVLIITLGLINYLGVNLGLYHFWPHFLFLYMPFLFLIGPTYYFYIRSLIDKSFRLSISQFPHFLLFLAAIFYHGSSILLSGSEKIRIVDAALADSTGEVSSVFIVYVSIHVTQTLFYLVKAFLLLQKVSISANEMNRRLMRWLQKFSIGFGGYWIFLFFWMLYLFVADKFFFEADYIFMLSNAVLINILVYSALYHNREFSQYLLAMFYEKYKRSTLSPEHSRAILKNLVNFMENEKPYLEPHLKISHLATRLSISTNILSQVLNQELNKNFFEFVNDYRIAEAIKRLSDPKFSHITIMGIALDSGFNNKNTFNRLFKKHTGQTPSQFLRNQ